MSWRTILNPSSRYFWIIAVTIAAMLYFPAQFFSVTWILICYALGCFVLGAVLVPVDFCTTHWLENENRRFTFAVVFALVWAGVRIYFGKSLLYGFALVPWTVLTLMCTFAFATVLWGFHTAIYGAPVVPWPSGLRAIIRSAFDSFICCVQTGWAETLAGIQRMTA